MATATIQDLLRNQDFRGLPVSEQLKGLGETDKDFHALPLEERLKALEDSRFFPKPEPEPVDPVEAANKALARQGVDYEVETPALRVPIPEQVPIAGKAQPMKPRRGFPDKPLVESREFIDVGPEAKPHHIAAERAQLDEAAKFAEQESSLKNLMSGFERGAGAPFGVPGAQPVVKSFVQGVEGLVHGGAEAWEAAGRRYGFPTPRKDFPQVVALGRFIGGATEKLAEMVDFFTTPEGAGLMTAMGAGPAWVRKGIEAGFSAGMAIGSWDLWKDFFANPSAQKAGEATMETMLALLPAAHAATPAAGRARLQLTRAYREVRDDFRTRRLEAEEEFRRQSTPVEAPPVTVSALPAEDVVPREIAGGYPEEVPSQSRFVRRLVDERMEQSPQVETPEYPFVEPEPREPLGEPVTPAALPDELPPEYPYVRPKTTTSGAGRPTEVLGTPAPGLSSEIPAKAGGIAPPPQGGPSAQPPTPPTAPPAPSGGPPTPTPGAPRKPESPAPGEPLAPTGGPGGGGLRRTVEQGKRIVTAREDLVRPTDTSRLPPDAAQHLTEFQKQGTATAIEAMDRDGGFLLADGTGTGKTPQGLTVAKHYADQGSSVVIVAPAGVWKFDNKTNKPTGSYGEWLDRLGLKATRYKKEPGPKPGEIQLATYSSFPAADQNTVFIFDEAHALKNMDSLRAAAGTNAARQAKATLFMTATPADKPLHIEYLERIGIFEGQSRETAFHKLGLIQRQIRTKNGSTKIWVVDPKVGELEVLNRLNGLFDRMIGKGSMLRREIAFDGIDMSVVEVPLPERTKQILGKIEDELTEGQGLDNAPGLLKARILMHQRRQQEPDKLAPALRIVKKELGEGRSVILFASRVNPSKVQKKILLYRDFDGTPVYDYETITESEGTLQTLKDTLKNEGIQFAEIHGGADEAGHVAMERFQSNKARVVIATIESGGTGINLDDVGGKNPRTMIVMTAPFSAVENTQAVGRVWRMSTKSNPRVYYLFGDTDVDRWNADIITSKMKTLGATVKEEVGKLDVESLQRRTEAGLPSGPPTPPETPKQQLGRPPVGVVRIPVSEIHADPVRFQFKAEAGEGGAGPELRGVTKFSREAAGVGLVWRDPADGKTYAINVHNRLALANRLGVEDLDVRYINAETAEEARLIGALTNIQEGHGTAIDAAKVFRDSGLMEADLAEQGVSLKGAAAREGMALAKLDDAIFDRVVQGDMPVARGVAIAEALGDLYSEQKALVALLDKTKRRLTNEEIGELARFVKSAGRQVEKQETLFGEEEVARSLAIEKAEISAYVKQRLGNIRRTFTTVSGEGKAKDLEAAGNVLARQENRRIAIQAAQAGEIYQKESTVAGPIADVLQQSAEALAKGENPNAVKEQAFERIRTEISKALPGPKEGRPEGAEADRERRPAQAQAKDVVELPNLPPQELAEAKRIAPLFLGRRSPGPSPKTNEEIAASARVKARPARGRMTQPVVYLNDEAASMIEVASRRHGLFHLESFEGVSLQPQHRVDLVRSLHREGESHSGVVREKFDEIAGAVQAFPEARTVALVRAGPLVSRAAVKETLRHEALHEKQAALGRGGFDVLGDRREEFMSKPGVVIATRNLVRKGAVDASDEVTLAAEIPVYLATGRAQLLGLSEQEAVQTLADYFDLLVDIHGLKAWNITDKMLPSLRRRLLEARKAKAERAPSVRPERRAEFQPAGAGVPDRGPGRAPEGIPRPIRERQVELPFPSPTKEIESRLASEYEQPIPRGAQSVTGTDRKSLAIEEEADRLYIGWKEGRSLDDLAKTFGVSRSTAGKIILRYEREYRARAERGLSPSIEDRLHLRERLGLRGKVTALPVEDARSRELPEESKDWISRGNLIEGQLRNQLGEGATVFGPSDAGEVPAGQAPANWSNSLALAAARDAVTKRHLERAQGVVQSARNLLRQQQFWEAWRDPQLLKEKVAELEGLIRSVKSGERAPLYVKKPPDRFSGSLFDPEEIAGGKPAGIEEATKDALEKSMKMPGRDVGSVEGSPLFGGSQGDLFGPATGEGLKEGKIGHPEDQKPLFMRRATPAQAQAAEAAGPAERRNYTAFGAAKNIFIRNLSQLEKASPAAHAAALRAAGSRGQTAVLLRGAAPEIENALGKDGPDFTTFRTALIESRLRGIHDRWFDLARQAENASDQAVKKGFLGALVDLLDNIEGKRDIPQDVTQTAAALLEGKEYDALRGFLAQTFRDAGNAVQSVMRATEFEAVRAKGGFQRALPVYKDLLEKPLAENHALNEGIFSDALGPLDTYYPLIGTPEKKPLAGQGRRTPYRKPRNIANYFATGLASGYNAGMEAFAGQLNQAIRANNKASLLVELQRQGLIRKLGPGERAGDAIVVDGVEYPAARVEIRPDRMFYKAGKKPQYAPPQSGLIPTWLEKELRPILEREHRSEGTVRRIVDAVNAFSLVGPLDLVFHSTNVIGAMVSNTPFVGRDVVSKTIGNTPFTKLANAVIKIVNTEPTTAEAIADLEQMAKLGLVPDRYGSETFSRRFAEQTGAKRKMVDVGPLSLPTGFGPLLYGPRGLDVRARLIMYRLSHGINPLAKPIEHAKFVNQLGNYVRETQGTIERAVKDAGMAPFYTAGSTMLRNGINAWLGTSPPPGGQGSISRMLGYKLAQQLSGGAVGMVALWALAYRAYDDEKRWPWEDPRAKLMQIPLKDEHRNSDLGKALYGERAGTAYVNLAFFSPLVSRGARALGITGAYEAGQLGATPGQMIEEAQRSSANAFIHPFTSGPLMRAPFVFATGAEPFVTTLRDDRGRFAPQFMPVIAKAPPGLPTLAERGLEATLSLNAFFRDIAGAAGFGQEAQRQEYRKANRWLRVLADITVPRLVGQASDPMFQAARFARQQAHTGERDELRRELRTGLEEGKVMTEAARKGLESGAIGIKDLREIARERRLPVMERRFSQLSLDEAVAAWKVATPAERERLRPILARKLRIAEVVK